MPVTMQKTLIVLVLGWLMTAPISSAVQSPSASTLEELRAKARERMERDRTTFTDEQLRDIDSLYQVANKDLRAPSSRETLLKVVAMYPHANRAGCALLYLAQMSPPDEREAYLKRAIEEHADAWYGDGTQVGPFAKAQLAALYAVTNRSAEAALLAEEVERSFPEAVDHSGNRLTNTLRKLKLLQ